MMTNDDPHTAQPLSDMARDVVLGMLDGLTDAHSIGFAPLLKAYADDSAASYVAVHKADSARGGGGHGTPAFDAELAKRQLVLLERREADIALGLSTLVVQIAYALAEAQGHGDLHVALASIPLLPNAAADLKLGEPEESRSSHAPLAAQPDAELAAPNREYRAIAKDILIGEATSPALTGMAVDAAIEPQLTAMAATQSAFHALLGDHGPQTIEQLNESYRLSTTLAVQAVELKEPMLRLVSEVVHLADALATQLADARGLTDRADVIRAL